MNNSHQIRQEKPSDIAGITLVISAAFKAHPFSDQTEHEIVNRLRASKQLTISLVAEVEQKIVGHIAFSPINVDGGFIQWYGLAPVAVHPDFQSQGIGSALINQGLTLLANKNANGCVLLGEPEYYRRFGFKAYNDLVFEGVDTKYFQAKVLNGELPKGVVTYHSSFS